MRKARIDRKTTETDISLELILEGTGEYSISTGCGFLNHMLQLFASHGGFNLDISCKGDTEVDYHHTVEDIAITLGKAFFEALGDCSGINRYGWIVIPMDEALVQVAVDISARGGYYTKMEIPAYRVGDFDVELVDEFFCSFCRTSGITVHIASLSGTNAHHIIEAAFKGFARALKQAVTVNPELKNRIPSTKGVLKEV